MKSYTGSLEVDFQLNKNVLSNSKIQELFELVNKSNFDKSNIKENFNEFQIEFNKKLYGYYLEFYSEPNKINLIDFNKNIEFFKLRCDNLDIK